MRKLGGFLLGSVVGLGVGLIAGSLLLPEDATDMSFLPKIIDNLLAVIFCVSM